MALVSQPVVADTPSQVVEQLRLQFNALLDALVSASVIDIASLQSGVSGTLAGVTGAKKVTLTKTAPQARKFPTK